MYLTPTSQLMVTVPSGTSGVNAWVSYQQVDDDTTGVDRVFELSDLSTAVYGVLGATTKVSGLLIYNNTEDAVIITVTQVIVTKKYVVGQYTVPAAGRLEYTEMLGWKVRTNSSKF